MHKINRFRKNIELIIKTKFGPQKISFKMAKIYNHYFYIVKKNFFKPTTKKANPFLKNKEILRTIPISLAAGWSFGWKEFGIATLASHQASEIRTNWQQKQVDNRTRFNLAGDRFRERKISASAYLKEAQETNAAPDEAREHMAFCAKHDPILAAELKNGPFAFNDDGLLIVVRTNPNIVEQIGGKQGDWGVGGYFELDRKAVINIDSITTSNYDTFFSMKPPLPVDFKVEVASTPRQATGTGPQVSRRKKKGSKLGSISESTSSRFGQKKPFENTVENLNFSTKTQAVSEEIVFQSVETDPSEKNSFENINNRKILMGIMPDQKFYTTAEIPFESSHWFLMLVFLGQILFFGALCCLFNRIFFGVWITKESEVQPLLSNFNRTGMTRLTSLDLESRRSLTYEEGALLKAFVNYLIAGDKRNLLTTEQWELLGWLVSYLKDLQGLEVNLVKNNDKKTNLNSDAEKSSDWVFFSESD